jgi:hypothetical protein
MQYYCRRSQDSAWNANCNEAGKKGIIMAQSGAHPKIVLLKGNGPIIINSEMMELITITLSHGLVGLPLKDLKADRVVIVSDLEAFWEIHKTIRDKPCCFVYSYETLDEEDLKRITAQSIEFI